MSRRLLRLSFSFSQFEVLVNQSNFFKSFGFFIVFSRRCFNVIFVLRLSRWAKKSLRILATPWRLSGTPAAQPGALLIGPWKPLGFLVSQDPKRIRFEVKHHHDWLITLSEESLPCWRLKRLGNGLFLRTVASTE